jgi:hypothetical protein
MLFTVQHFYLVPWNRTLDSVIITICTESRTTEQWMREDGKTLIRNLQGVNGVVLGNVF